MEIQSAESCDTHCFEVTRKGQIVAEPGFYSRSKQAFLALREHTAWSIEAEKMCGALEVSPTAESKARASVNAVTLSDACV